MIIGKGRADLPFLAQSGTQEDVFLPIKIKFAFRRREGEP